MKILKKLTAVMCVIAIFVSLLITTPIMTQAASGDMTYRTVNWNGQEWELQSTEDANGDLVEVSYIDDAGNLNPDGTAQKVHLAQMLMNMQAK